MEFLHERDLHILSLPSRVAVLVDLTTRREKVGVKNLTLELLLPAGQVRAFSQESVRAEVLIE